MAKNLKVFILGAGCSADYGYPLAKDFVECLKNYGKELETRANCDRLKQSVASTIALMEQSRTQTIDRLVRWIDEEPTRIGSRSILYEHPDNKPWKEKTSWADEQILNAKIVTMALFLERGSCSENRAVRVSRFPSRYLRWK